MNRTQHRPNTGLSTLARAEYDRELAALRRLAESRTEQVDLAFTFIARRKNRPVLSHDEMEENNYQRIIFEETLFAFKIAHAVKDPSSGKTMKGAIRVAAEAAAEANKEFFKDDHRKVGALEASEWAQDALRWAGNKIFRAKSPVEKPADTTPATPPATNVPTPAQAFGRSKVRATA